MPTYVALVSHKASQGLRSTIHAAGCSVVVNKTPRDGAHRVEAATAAEAARQWDVDNQTQERGIKRTVACKCCRDL